MVPVAQLIINHVLLYEISFYFLALGLGFLILYIALLYKPKTMTKTKNQVLFMLVYGGFLSIIFFIPEAVGGDIAPNGTFSDIQFFLTLTIYLLCFFISALIFTIFMSIKVLKSISDPDIAKRIKVITFLLYAYFYNLLGMVIINFLNNPFLQNAFYGSEVIIIVVVILTYIAFYKRLPLQKREK